MRVSIPAPELISRVLPPDANPVASIVSAPVPPVTVLSPVPSAVVPREITLVPLAAVNFSILVTSPKSASSIVDCHLQV